MLANSTLVVSLGVLPLQHPLQLVENSPVIVWAAIFQDRVRLVAKAVQTLASFADSRRMRSSTIVR